MRRNAIFSLLLATSFVAAGGAPRPAVAQAVTANAPIADLQPLSSAPDQPSHTPSPAAATLQVQAHDIRIQLLPDQGQLVASDTMAVAVKAGRTHRLNLAASLQVQKVTIAGKAIPIRRDGDGLDVTLPAGFTKGSLTVYYRGAWVNGPYDFVAANSVLLRPESRWYPQPAGRSTPARFRVMAQVPKGWTAVAPGELQQGAYQLGRPVLGVALSAGRWQRHTYKSGANVVNLYLDPSNAALAPAYGSEIGRLLSYCQGRLGKYPHGVITMTETAVAGGYGGEAFLSVGSRVMSVPRVRSSYLAHGVLHSWTDRLLASGTEGEAGFLNEGLTTYLTAIYDSAQPGARPPMQRQSMGRLYLGFHGTPHDVPIVAASAATGTAPWVGLVYQKGALVLHDLHRRLGDQAFWATIRALFDRYADKPVGLAHLQVQAEATIGESLSWWFDQWLDRPGAPNLALQDVQVVADEGGYVVTGRVIQQGGTYRLKVPLWIDTVEAREGFSLTLARAEQPFSVRVSAPPKLLAVDPDYHLLAVRQPPPTLQALPDGPMLIVAGQRGPDAEERQAAAALARTMAARYQDAGKTVTVRTDAEVTDEDLQAAAAVLLIGRPALNPWVAKVPGLPLSLQDDRFELNGAAYELPGYGVLQTVPGPWRSGQVVGVMAGLGAPGLRKLGEVRLGFAPIEVVSATESRVIDSSTYPVLDPRLAVSFTAVP